MVESKADHSQIIFFSTRATVSLAQLEDAPKWGTTLTSFRGKPAL